MFIFPFDERLMHASILDGIVWYRSQNLHWTAHALEDIHHDKYGALANCTHCCERSLKVAEHIHSHDSSNLFDEDERPKPPTPHEKWSNAIINTMSGPFVAFNALPPDLQDEIRRALNN